MNIPNYNIARISGTSMLPCIRPGDTVIYDKTAKKDQIYKTGDIVIRLIGSKRVVHRIVKITNQSCITKGDNKPFFDRPILLSDIIGIAILIKSKENTYKLSSKKARIYAYYCVLNSYYSFYIHTVAIWLSKYTFRGRSYLLRFLK